MGAGAGPPPTRIVRDSMLGLAMPDVATWSPRVTVVLGQNPGPFTGPGTNTYLIGTGRRRVLLDTGQGVPAYLPLLEGAVQEHAPDGLEGMVLTHAHPDHVGGVDGIQQRFGPTRMAKKVLPDRPDVRGVTPIDDGAVVTTGGATLRAVFTPGHARDHLCFYLEEERALFTGDVILGAATTVIGADGDLADYLASLRRLQALDLAVIYPAHGPAIRAPYDKIAQYIAHRELREQQIVEALAAGVSRVPALVERLYTDVPTFLHAAAAMSVGAHLRKLHAEGRVRLDGDAWYLEPPRR